MNLAEGGKISFLFLLLKGQILQVVDRLLQHHRLRHLSERLLEYGADGFIKNKKLCCGGVSGIRCRIDPWLRDPK
jgi:hypothetical protein